MRIFKPRKRIYEDYAHQFATFLRNFRKEHGYTQQDLAKYIGVSQSCISGIENCYWMPTLNVFMELIDFCVGEDAFFNFMMENVQTEEPEENADSTIVESEEGEYYDD